MLSNLCVKFCRLLLQLGLKLKHVLDLLSDGFLPLTLGLFGCKLLFHSLNLRLLFLGEARVFSLLWVRRLVHTSILSRLVKFRFLGSGLLLRFLRFAFRLFLVLSGGTGSRFRACDRLLSLCLAKLINCRILNALIQKVSGTIFGLFFDIFQGWG